MDDVSVLQSADNGTVGANEISFTLMRIGSSSTYLKAPDDMHYGIALADVRQKLVPKSFAL